MSFNLTQWLKDQAKDDTLPILPLAPTCTRGGTATIDDNREWLVSNGLGTYASASISGANTRRYHGLLVASLTPPVRRTVLLSRLDEIITPVGANPVELATNYWSSGHTHPRGFARLESFCELPVPTWCYRLDSGRLIKQIVMLHGLQRVDIGYTWLPDDGKSSCDLDFTVLLAYRDFHGEMHGNADWRFKQDLWSNSAHAPIQKVRVEAFEGAQAFWLEIDRGAYNADTDWYWDYKWPREYERGLNDREDLFRSGRVHTPLAAGQSMRFTAGLDPQTDPKDRAATIADLVARAALQHRQLIDSAPGSKSATRQKLLLAADQFVAHRQSTASNTVIAGYHWFSDWGRDSMISLPGLCIATGRPEQARSILSTFGKYLSQGMLPNYFPDSGIEPEYNTSDATLWWAWALNAYHGATGDLDFVATQLPLLREVVRWHITGTRHGIKLDTDGLIAGGDANVQLTWMDAKVGGFVVTPRSGKAVEINALWYNFLLTLDALEQAAGDAPGEFDYQALAARCKAGFEKFWLEDAGYLADVIGYDGVIDRAIRPNQLIAASLTYPILSAERTRRMLDIVEGDLLTPYGLRTLSPADAQYQGIYGTGIERADQYHRDITYHQGTVWPWLLGPWVNARVYARGENDSNLAFIKQRLQSLIAHIDNDGCVGSINEIFDGDAPHVARGCVAQAWSIAELLRVTSKWGALG
ncbi:MAG: amylo-alpha-1,6-glucosidase [Candidatus Obscuribacterales bacterium]|nr:amylo-alpha-1,6-glucosidase [Candidatus Obscuribacterales bacterium]